MKPAGHGHRQHDRPSALTAGVSTEEELAVALEELEVLLGEATFFEHGDIAADRPIAHEEGACTRI